MKTDFFIELSRQQLHDAIVFATNAHRKQLDKAGVPYIFHSLRVMLAVQEFGLVHAITAVLHDVVEDTNITLEDVRAVFGQEVADAVDSVTRRDPAVETYRQFVERTVKHPIGRVVKIADIRDNMTPERLGPELKGLRKRYELALGILLQPGEPQNMYEAYQVIKRQDPKFYEVKGL